MVERAHDHPAQALTKILRDGMFGCQFVRCVRVHRRKGGRLVKRLSTLEGFTVDL